MAHIAFVNQSNLRDNAALHYYVGPASCHQQGIPLFNLKTNQTIVRRSFQQLDNNDAQICHLQFQSSSDNVLTLPINQESSDEFPVINSTVALVSPDSLNLPSENDKPPIYNLSSRFSMVKQT